MNNEPNKPVEAEELTEKELEGVVGGGKIIGIDLGTNNSCVSLMEGGQPAINTLAVNRLIPWGPSLGSARIGHGD